jgi:hypothetical protein
MFNATLAMVEGRLHIKSTEVFTTPKKVGFALSNDKQYVLSFLDMFFQGNAYKVILIKALLSIIICTASGCGEISGFLKNRHILVNWLASY